MEWAISLGFFGLFLSCFIAATILPFSSEIVVATFLALKPDAPIEILLIASAGNFLGGLTCYLIGMLGKKEWISRLGVEQQSILRCESYIKKYGALTALLCWVPFLGDLLAVALGFFRVRFTPMAICMFLGKFGRYYVCIYLTDYFLK
ncbi:MAG: DedA family protein [Alistipes sp.]|nr:DedA family protein [Candidatus Alistipes equi]